jgi:hypothetical protein
LGHSALDTGKGLLGSNARAARSFQRSRGFAGFEAEATNARVGRSSKECPSLSATTAHARGFNAVTWRDGDYSVKHVVRHSQPLCGWLNAVLYLSLQGFALHVLDLV